MSEKGSENKKTFYLRMDSCSENEQFARMVAAAFAARLDPTVEEIEDLKAAVSEAVTNCVIHGYRQESGEIVMEGILEGQELTLVISDQGRGIEDIVLAMAPFFTTAPDKERSGMGFTFMQTFMDELQVESTPGQGTRVIMKKRFRQEN